MPDDDDQLARSRLDALRQAVSLGLQSACAGRFVDGRVLEHELRQELDQRFERRKTAGRRRT